GYSDQAALVIRPALGDEIVESGFRTAPHENVDGSLAPNQLVDQVAADESGSPGHEITHCGTPSGVYQIQTMVLTTKDTALAALAPLYRSAAPLTRFGGHARKIVDHQQEGIPLDERPGDTLQTGCRRRPEPGRAPGQRHPAQALRAVQAGLARRRFGRKAGNLRFCRRRQVRRV